MRHFQNRSHFWPKFMFHSILGCFLQFGRPSNSVAFLFQVVNQSLHDSPPELKQPLEHRKSILPLGSNKETRSLSMPRQVIEQANSTLIQPAASCSSCSFLAVLHHNIREFIFGTSRRFSRRNTVVLKSSQSSLKISLPGAFTSRIGKQPRKPKGES